MRKRILSILLCLVMVVGLFPTMAFAADGSEATTGRGTASDPYCVSTYDEMKRLLETPASYYIKVVGMDNDSANEGVPIRRLTAGRDFESTAPAIDIPSGAHHHLEIATNVWFIADRKDGDKNIFSRLIDVGSGSSLEITGTGSLRVEVNAKAVKNAIIDNWGGELTIDGSVVLNGIQDFTTNVATRPIWIDGGVTNIKGGYIYGHNNMKATSDEVTSAISFGNNLAYGTELNILGGTIKQVNNKANQGNENSCALYVKNDKAADAIHLTGGIFEGGMKMKTGKPLSDLLTTGYQFYDMDANTAFDGSVSKTQKKLTVTPTGVNPTVIDKVSLNIKSLNERKTLSDLACSYSPNNKMVLDNFAVFKGLNNQWDKIEDQNTPYDANQEYTVMYVFYSNAGFSFSNNIEDNVTVTGGDFWKADSFGGLTNTLRVFVNFPACTIDNASLTIKSPNERRTLSDLECSYSPNTKMVLDNFVVFEGLNNQWDKIEDQTKPYDANQDYTVMYVFYSNAGFSFSNNIEDNVTVTGGDFWKADSFGGRTDILRVFVNFPREEVPHSIKIINGRGTANPTSAMAGETVTVTAKDDTANYMMFTQWYTDTPGVTFANATQQETTFVMPDCDVKVSPGFQQVLFRKQPVPQISLEKGYGGKTSFAFSWDISKWELVDTATNQTVSSGDTPVKAGKQTDATIPANTDLGNKTYRIVVTTANGEQFKSNDFIVTWFEKMPAPLVEFSIPSGTKFIGELTVNVGCPSTLETGGASPFETCYTTNGIDPKDADPSDIQRYYGYTDVTLTKTTHFMARTILEGEGGNEDTWGELCVASYEMIDKLDAPTVTPESCSYSGSLPIIVTIQDIYNAKIDFSVKQHDGYLSGGDEPGPVLETGLPDTFCGTTTFRAKAIVYKDGGGAWESDEVTYTYTREYWANISNATISGKVNEAIDATDVTITLDGEKFKDVAVGDDVSGWFNLPAGLTAKVKEQTSYSRELVITISGTPTATSAAAITVTIPKDKLLANNTTDLTVLSNPKAVYNIGTDVVHTHTYGEWKKWDGSEHYQSCTCGDMKFEAHTFGNWTSDTTKHYKECSVCKGKVEEAAHVESNMITDTPAGIGTPGTWHTECFVCGKQMNTGTIPALVKIDVAKLNVAKPVKDAAAEMATTGDSTYYVANTEWTAADGATLAIGEKFKPGTAYTVKITLEAKNSNVFTADSTYNKIEGKDAKLVTAVTGYTDSVILTYTFDATEGTYVPTKPAITTAALPDGKVGDAYSQTLAATGTNPIAWSIETGNLPDGLTLVGDTIKGTPSKAGDFKFTVKATNSGGSDTKELTIKVADAEAAKYHNVTLTDAGTGATGAGSHAAGTTVNIYAGTKSGYTFNGWTSGDVTVLSASSKNASFVMPDKDVTVKANWVYNGGGSSGGYTYYTIKATAGVNGSISPTGNVSVREGSDQTFTITPNKGYAVAKVLIDSKNVGAVKSYTFENVKKNHTIEVVFMKASGNPQTGVFVDVPEGSYYEEAVNWAVEKGITTGTDATHFSPNGICTRAQAVTFLWRAAGSPAAKSAVMPFTDVKAGSYYYDAVLWAVENGITKGTSDTMFSPDATCSRAQIVTFLWRSQKSPAAGTANPFTDVKASAYYADAVLWAVKEDVTKGTTNTTFSPDANCTRAQIVTFIWRALAE